MLRERQTEMRQAGLNAALWHEAADLEFGGTTDEQTTLANSFEHYDSHWSALRGSSTERACRRSMLLRRSFAHQPRAKRVRPHARVTPWGAMREGPEP